MHQTIWKYPLQFKETTRLNMPEGARPLTVQMQGAVPTLWAVVDSDNTTLEVRQFHLAGIGHPLRAIDPLHTPYLGTFQAQGLVFHVFEVPYV